MSPAERVAKLRKRRERLRDVALTSGFKERSDLLAGIIPLLNFDETYHLNGMRAADLLAQPGHTQSAYQNAAARLDTLIAQAVISLEHGLTPIAPPPQRSPQALDDEQGLLWFWTHCTWRVRWYVVTALVTVLPRASLPEVATS